MLFSRNWLADYVELPAELEELTRRLTFAGHAVEGVEERGGDVVLDVDVTTNRCDCMNHRGLAREIAALTGAPLAPLELEVGEGAEPAERRIAIEVEDVEGCPRYVGRVIRGVEIGPSPEWLARRLETLGLRPINNVVDITNYVLWETGQPLHAFDLATLGGARIVVRRARPGETLVTLDGESRELDEEVLVIADAERAVALAGIMGGLETEVTEATVDVLLESAHFDRRRVRRGARLLGLKTDASHRFERGADPEGCADAATRAAAMIAEIAGGTVSAGTIDVREPAERWRLEGELDSGKLDRFAGVEIPAADVERWLAALGFGLEPASDRSWRASVPSWRFYDFCDTKPSGDVYEADLYEEVLRMHGFEGVPAALPALPEPDPGSSAGHHRRERIQRHLAACGFAETISFAFGPPEADGVYPQTGAAGEPLALDNPLSELYSTMRRSLLPGLAASAGFNQRRGAEAVRIFEVGHVFPGGDRPEREMVALVAGGTVGSPWDGVRELDFFDLKGVLESLVERAGQRLAVEAAELPGTVPGSACVLSVAGGETIGWLGQLDLESPYPLFGAELETAIFPPLPVPVEIEIPSRFPSVEADITVTHDLDVGWTALAAAIDALEVPNLVSFRLKDRYRGEGVPAGKVNTTVAFRYNAPDRSLTQDEVNEAQSMVTAELDGRFGEGR